MTFSLKPNQHLVGLSKFFLIAFCGATLDFGLFYFFTELEIEPFFSNLISASCAVILVYFLSKIYLYQKSYSKKEFFQFTTWYAISITIFSSLITLVLNLFSFEPALAKFLVMPISFLTNYFVGRVILHG